jgi:hypothetical protein
MVMKNLEGKLGRSEPHPEHASYISETLKRLGLL